MGRFELQLGNWESAIKYLESYNGKDEILAARAKACIGDAYVGLENYEKALACFEHRRQSEERSGVPLQWRRVRE